MRYIFARSRLSHRSHAKDPIRQHARHSLRPQQQEPGPDGVRAMLLAFAPGPAAVQEDGTRKIAEPPFLNQSVAMCLIAKKLLAFLVTLGNEDARRPGEVLRAGIAERA